MRTAIARRMTKSKQEAPHFYVSAEVRLDAVEALIAAEAARQPAQRFTATVALIRAVAVALREEPRLNSVWTDDVATSKPQRLNVGVAVALEGGLIAPALLGVDRAWTFARRRKPSPTSSPRARAQKLKPPELTMDATFTLSNLGMFDVRRLHGDRDSTARSPSLRQDEAVPRLLPAERGGVEAASMMSGDGAVPTTGPSTVPTSHAFFRPSRVHFRSARTTSTAAINRSEVAVP